MTSSLRKLIVSSLLVVVSSVAYSEEYLLRLMPDVPNDVLTEIAENAEPIVVEVSPGADIARIVEEQYSDAASRMWQIVAAANKAQGIENLPENLPETFVVDDGIQYFILPAGPKWSNQPKTLVLSQGETLSELVAEQIGRMKVTEYSSIISQKLDTPPTKIPAGRPIPIPLSTGSFIANFNYEDPNEAERLLERAKSSNTLAEGRRLPVASMTEMVDNKSASSLLLAACDVSSIDDTLEYFDWKEIEATLKENQRVLKEQGKGGKFAVVVADTGIQLRDKRLRLWRNPTLAAAHEEFGFNLVDRNLHPVIDEGAPKRVRDHGSHVAGIIDGTVRSGLDPAIVGQSTELMIVKIADENGDVQTGTINLFVEKVTKFGNARVVNLSIDSYNDANFTWRHLVAQKGKNLLFVVAAGNGRGTDSGEREWLDVSESDLFPAKLGGENEANVISVAAHTSTGVLAGFSNRNEEAVDIAAPGCLVSSLNSAGGMTTYSGTSQAAPYVSFVAGTLFSLGLPDPGSIKDRILSTVDFDPDNLAQIYSRGRLNILRAIDISRDVIEKSDKSRMRGTVLDQYLIIDGARVCRSEITRIKFVEYQDDGTAKIIYWKKYDPNRSAFKLVRKTGTLDVDQIQFHPAGPISATEIEDIVFSPLLATNISCT